MKLKVRGYGLDYNNIVIGNRLIFTKGKTNKLYIDGLGLTRCEREIYGNKFMECTGIVNLYIGKYIITYNKLGYKHQFKNMEISN